MWRELIWWLPTIRLHHSPGKIPSPVGSVVLCYGSTVGSDEPEMWLGYFDQVDGVWREDATQSVLRVHWWEYP